VSGDPTLPGFAAPGTLTPDAGQRTGAAALKPAPFAYHAPTTVDTVVDLLAQFGDEAKVLAGGQSLVPLLALRLARFEHLIDLNRVVGLRGIERAEGRRGIEQADGSVVIGAMTRQSEVVRSPIVSADVPLLGRASRLIGHFQIRNRGTVGGSLAHADPAAEIPTVALALDADLEVVGRAGTRWVPASSFFEGTWSTAVAPDELLAGVRFPVWPARAGFAFEEVARRVGDFGIVGAGVALALDGSGAVTRASIALLGMGPTPLRAPAAEAALFGVDAADVDEEELGRLAVADTEPPHDVHASRIYRRRVGAVVVATALRRALEEAGYG
jgi:carbon-monoxide dehydrogenase medium subunit